MKYRIELAATAKADIRGQAQWLRENISPPAAAKWLDGLYKAIDTLQTRPTAVPGRRRERQVPRGNPRVALRQAWQAETQASDHLHGPRGYRLRPLCPSHRP